MSLKCKGRNRKVKVVSVCLGDATFITRFHRTVSTLLELGYNVEAYSVKPLTSHNLQCFPNSFKIDGIFRKLRGKYFSCLRYLEIGFRFFCKIYKAKPDMIFSHNLPGLIIGVITRSFLKWKHIAIIYDAMELESGRSSHTPSFIPFDQSNKMKTKMERVFARRANLVISADFVRTEIMEDNLGIRNILTCRNVSQMMNVPYGKLFHTAIGLPKENFIILYQGHIVEGRGLENTIRSLSALPENMVFIIMGFGRGTYVDSLRMLAKTLRFGKRVYFRSAVESEKLLNWTACADIVQVLTQNTSLSYYTAAPNKLYEAAMAGVPVVASNFPEIKSVLHQYEFGRIVDPESVEEIAEAMLFLYKNEKIRERYRKNALEAARCEFNWAMESLKLKSKLIDIEAGLLHDK